MKRFFPEAKATFFECASPPAPTGRSGRASQGFYSQPLRTLWGVTIKQLSVTAPLASSREVSSRLEVETLRIPAIALLLSLTSVQLLAQNATGSGAELITTLSGHTKSIEHIEFSSSGDVVATGSRNRTVRVWNVVSGECLVTIVGDGADLSKLNWSGDGRRLALTYRSEKTWEVVVWEVPANRPPIVGKRFPGAYFYEWSRGRCLGATAVSH